MSAVMEAPHPVGDRRAEYQPAWPQEQFIVPLLRGRIAGILEAYAAPAPPQGRALDIGCGRQPLRKSLDALGYSYVSADIEQNTEGSVDVLCALDQPLPAALISKGPFQFVLCTEVLEHVADWDAAFTNLATVLAPGGRLLITCPHFYQLHEEPYDFWRPTPHALRYFADRVGLRVLTQEAAGDAWDVLGTLLANCHPAAATPRLTDRLAAKVMRLGKRCLFGMMTKRWPQKAIRLDGPLYISNIAVLEKHEPETHD